MEKEYIYIMTNPALSDMIIIGCTDNVERERKKLSTVALPYEYEVYAIYEIYDYIAFKKLQMMIDGLNSKLRVSSNKNFYRMTPDEAYKILDTIAAVSNTSDKLKIMNKAAAYKNSRVKKTESKRYNCDYSDFI